MAKANIILIDRRNIKSGKLVKLIPEFYELKKVIENNNSHHKESVFDHTFSVFDNLGKTLRKLNKKNELLKLAALFHDIAKKETIIINDNGLTSCPGHEDGGLGQSKENIKTFQAV